MRLIDADELKKELESSKYIVPNDLNRLLNSEINRCIEAIDNAPTIEEKPQGEWINKGIYYECSNCRFGYMMSITRHCLDLDVFNYCPYCGADMRGEEE